MKKSRRSEIVAAGPRILMAASLAVFVVVIVALMALGASSAVVSLVGAAVLISCGLACVWTWRLSLRQERSVQRAIRALAESRGAAQQQGEDSR